ncbi:MAG TPA: hypothetical protein VF488_05720, partial [Gemmatimonadaceae bacterium]
MRAHLLSASVALGAAMWAGREARAQHEGHAAVAADSSTPSPTSNRLHVMAQAIPVVTHAHHTAGGRDLTEG